jgi:hypothetical protein
VNLNTCGQASFQCLLLLVSLMVLSANAVEPQPGQIYTGGTLISSSELGVGFNIPQGWRGALAPSGESFLMEPGDAGATLFVVADKLSKEKAYTQLQGPIPLNDRVQLTLDGPITRSGGDLSAHYNVAYQPQYRARVMATTTKAGTSIAFFLLSRKDALESYAQQLEKSFTSLTVSAATKSTATTQDAATDSDDTWAGYLKGKHIVRFYTTSGYTEEQHIWMCSDGRFRRSFDSGGFGGGTPGASGAFQGHYGGRWQAKGQGEYGQLLLSFNDGQVSRYELRWDYGKNQLFLDGKRWLHDKNNLCQ